jgi:hypothetical protein
MALPHQPTHIRAIGSASAPFSRAMASVNFIGAFEGDALGFWHTMEYPLSTEGLDEFQVLLDFWNPYKAAYRTRFSG